LTGYPAENKITVFDAEAQAILFLYVLSAGFITKNIKITNDWLNKEGMDLDFQMGRN